VEKTALASVSISNKAQAGLKILFFIVASCCITPNFIKIRLWIIVHQHSGKDNTCHMQSEF